MASAFKRKLSQSIGTVLTSVGSYTVPASTQVTIIGLTVANVLTTAIAVDVTLYNGATDTYITKNCPIAAGGTLVLAGGEQKIVLEVGDSIRVKSSDATSADVVMSVLELT